MASIDVPRIKSKEANLLSKPVINTRPLASSKSSTQSPGYAPDVVVAGTFTPGPRKKSMSILGLIINAVVLLAVIGAAYWGYSFYRSRQVIPEVVQKVISETTASPADRSEQKVEKKTPLTVGQRFRQVLEYQSTIAVPHELPSDGSKIIRVEPDGIHIRTSSGIVKMNMEQMPEELREKYHIYQDTAVYYRKTHH